jgi:hypothetical protein
VSRTLRLTDVQHFALTAPAAPKPSSISAPQRQQRRVAFERDVLAAVLKLLRLHPRVAWAHRMNVFAMKVADRYVKAGFRGMADITGQLKDGRRLEVEVKRPGERMTPEQEVFLTVVRSHGGVALCVHSIDELATELVAHGVR